MLVTLPNFTLLPFRGFVHVCVQHVRTHVVHALEPTNEAGWRSTLQTGEVYLYSLSRKTLYVLADQKDLRYQMVDMRLNEDRRSLLYLIENADAVRPRISNNASLLSHFPRFIAAPKIKTAEGPACIEISVHPSFRSMDGYEPAPSAAPASAVTGR